MVEITLGSNEDSSGGSGGSSNDIMETLEGMKKFLSENPEMAKAFGIDLGGMEETMHEANQAAESAGVELDHSFLTDLLEGVEEAGFGDMSVSEVRKWVEDNPTMVDNMIEENI